MAFEVIKLYPCLIFIFCANIVGMITNRRIYILTSIQFFNLLFYQHNLKLQYAIAVFKNFGASLFLEDCSYA